MLSVVLRLFFNTNKTFLLPTALPSVKKLRRLYGEERLQVRPDMHEVVTVPERRPWQHHQQQAGFNEEDYEKQSRQQTGPPECVASIITPSYQTGLMA